MRTVIRDINIPLIHNNTLVMRLIVQPDSMKICFHHINTNNGYVYTIFDNIYELLSQVKSSRERKVFKGLKEKEVKSIIFQTLSGLSYMHKMGYFHRDLKPENILINTSDLNTKNKIKLIDFGTS